MHWTLGHVLRSQQSLLLHDLNKALLQILQSQFHTDGCIRRCCVDKAGCSVPLSSKNSLGWTWKIFAYFPGEVPREGAYCVQSYSVSFVTAPGLPIGRTNGAQLRAEPLFYFYSGANLNNTSFILRAHGQLS